MTNQEVEAALVELPDQVASALETWRTRQVLRERLGAKLFLRFKAEGIADGGRAPSRETLEAMVENDDEHFKERMAEVGAESAYVRLYEKLMAAKHMSKIRTAF